MLFSTFLTLAVTTTHARSVSAIPASSPQAHILPRSATPTVSLDKGVFTGITNANGTVEQFTGIPFAKPPTGDLRFRLPVAIPTYNGAFDATSFGPSCPQQKQSSNTGAPPTSGEESEDCLTINILRPVNMTSSSKLPVAAWIYGGGFQVGTTEQSDGSPIVERSVALKTPIIYVSFNYRISGFGFIAGKEVKDAGVGNIGLHDQREAFRWIQKYISAFGGDPRKITVWGESAGSVSIALHMIANNGNIEGLFRAAFMQSGAAPPFGYITNPQGQDAFDTVVAQTGCSGTADKLACLRAVPYEKIKEVFDAGPDLAAYKSLVASWTPRADGRLLTDLPQKLVTSGKIASIPFVIGDVDDEGTIFSLSLSNITTDALFRSYIHSVYLTGASDADISAVASAYPDDLTQGSPFDTGSNNSITPEYKRLAAFQGDLVFQAPRRLFLEKTAGKQNTWVFLSKRMKSTPTVGAFHGSDISNVYSNGDMADYLINFVVSLNPNGVGATRNPGLIPWPKYDMSRKQLLTFTDESSPLVLTADTYRQDAMALLTRITGANPI